MGPSGNALLCWGTGCLKLSRLASAEVREALHFPSYRKQSVSGFLRETHPLLGEGCQDGRPALTGLWHAPNRDLGSFLRRVRAGAWCWLLWGRAEAGAAFRGSPSHVPAAGARRFPPDWELLGLLLRLRHRLGLLRTSDSAVTSDRKRWWADFSFFVFTGRTSSCPFPTADNSSV